jgi:hypothetical protein
MVMADVVLEGLGSGYNLSNIQTNFDRIETAINEQMLHLNGDNNRLEQGVDINSNILFNLPQASLPTQAVPLSQVTGLIAALNQDYTGTAYEIQYSSASQIDYNLNLITYEPNSNNLQVWVELDVSGVPAGFRLFPNQYEELDASTVRLNIPPLPADTPIMFVVNSDPISSGGTGGGSGGGATEESVLVQTIINNIALGNVFTETATFTIDSSKSYGYTRIDSTSVVNVLVPFNDNLPDGVEFHFRQVSTGGVIFVPLSPAVINPPAGGTLDMGGQGATVTLKKAGVNEWDLIGQVYALGT